MTSMIDHILRLKLNKHMYESQGVFHSLSLITICFGLTFAGVAMLTMRLLITVTQC